MRSRNPRRLPPELRTEDEVEEMEGIMGDLTAQLAELSKLRKDDEAEYDRNRRDVAGFRGKYREASS